MKNVFTKKICLLWLFAILVVPAVAESGLVGDAVLNYTKYDAKYNEASGGAKSFGGNSLSQEYTLGWRTSNLSMRGQSNYYDVLVGYEWLTFSTSINDNNENSKLSETVGKLLYAGKIAHTMPGGAVRFTAYADDTHTSLFNRSVFSGSIVDDKLTSGINAAFKSLASGFTFTFIPELARTPQMRALPALHLVYNEYINKGNGTTIIDTRTKELAVAGLNKENNWLHYRTTKYENFLNANDNYDQQQFQIGLVDQGRRRTWATLTNWINISADGQLTTRTTISPESAFEEYDLNLFAIASRKGWSARTFLNYNRLLNNQLITEAVRIPVYVEGVWGADTNWRVGVSSRQVREIFETVTSRNYGENNLSLKATTFNRSKFTLTPSLVINSNKYSDGSAYYDLDAGVETASTSRFSNTLNLFAGYHLTRKNTSTSGNDDQDTSAHKVDLNASYRPSSRFIYAISEQFLYGKGADYAFSDSSRIPNSYFSDVSSANIVQGRYTASDSFIRSVTNASVAFTKSSELTTSLALSYDYMKRGNLPLDSIYSVMHYLTYNRQKTVLRLDTKYWYRSDVAASFLTQSGEFRYRPDTLNDFSVRSIYARQTSFNGSSSKLELVQKYSRNFFARNGVTRSLANISEELAYTNTTYVTGGLSNSKYLMVSGRYSPTARLSLNGSIKYLNDVGVITMLYSAGLGADFKLLTASLDYTFAKRDADNRLEKRLSASVRRTF